MFVLRKNVDGLTAIIDRLAARCLPRQSHGRVADAAEIRLMRKLTLAFLPALPVVPAAVSLTLGAAIGLPLGFGLVVALYMMAAVALIAGRRVGAESVANLAATAAAQSADAGSPYDLCPGLFLGLDAAGLVRTAGGRDRQMFVSFLREPLSRPFVDQVHVSDRLSFVQALDALRQGADAVVIDLRLDRPVLGLDHTQFLNVRMDMTAVRCADGALTGVQAQILDIEGEMQIRDTVSVKENEAVAAHEAKSRFLAAVSHELRTPLNAILGFSDILAGEYFGKLANDRQREYVQLIRQSGAHLLSVVNTMLDMSKIEAGRYELLLEPFAIAETVTECERMLSLQAASKGVKLTSRLPRGLGEAVADSRALRQVIINLVGNAIKFTDNGGAVIIDASRTATDLVISVSDTGIGMAPEKLSMLGRPFTQVHDDLNRNYEGTGLGLSLVKGLIALHGGTFAISSHPGEGTVVTVTLPVDGSGAVAQAENEDNMVEFPPRLTAQPAARRREGKETGYDQANAKIA
ncbi:integral membrane sensor signal transduction histidine kinase [Rhizobium sp. PDO1-076]|uniref:sensor histidine kinase n=1 Tax=Rhizobium sp. PDO1-076 TaxID=1125979 RepID=UPI00024E3703|nr:HAMP domain-containing sensor histidine kinase [Rhizobium sp. PDO1-076]EHS53384.1 integral membrane sensor signal transduction histidine kinase [Rhizobium sp. PDO1-076]